jgi:TonB family protein
MMTRKTNEKKSRARQAGILGTVIFHLLAAILLVSAGIARVGVHEGLEITLSLPDEEAARQRAGELQRLETTPRESADEETREMLRAIAVNEEIAAARDATRAPVEREIERYISEIQGELGRAAARDGRYTVASDPRRAADSLQALEARRQRELDSLQSTVHAGESSVSYKLKDRYKTRLPIPVFRCEFGGTVIVAITVDPRGEVLKATVVDQESSTDDCLREVAVEAALRSRFNADEKAPSPQRGTITYNFVRQ